MINLTENSALSLHPFSVPACVCVRERGPEEKKKESWHCKGLFYLFFIRPEVTKSKPLCESKWDMSAPFSNLSHRG